MSFFVTNTSICDSTGNLLFYTNGLNIGNSNYDTVINATNFNPGEATSDGEPDGLSASQGALFIPGPSSPSLYYLFHITGDNFFANGQFETQPTYLSYTLIDAELDNGKGAVLNDFKNIHIINDTLTWGRLSACKHGNGRDWWVIIHRYYSNLFFKLLITPQGIEGPFEQQMGSIVTKDIYGQACFSPDGSRFAMISPSDTLDYFQFNRCTGEFYDPLIISVPDSTGTIGCSFSPNNRFLYVSSKYNLYQYDTWNSNMIENVIHIAAWDTFKELGVSVFFDTHQLAPDNKIYISSFNGVSYLNVINSPDLFGLSCDFAPHSFVLPQYNSTLPTFPNYDLGALQGSPCDTLSGLSTSFSIPYKSSYRIVPNPVSDWLNIIYQNSEDALFELFDINGRRVAAVSLYHYFRNRLIEMNDLPAGVYLATVTQNGKQVWSEKVVVVQ
ncbi:MAG: T9SS type A sorting domain-containing protein [Chitinophagales bacterium]